MGHLRSLNLKSSIPALSSQTTRKGEAQQGLSREMHIQWWQSWGAGVLSCNPQQVQLCMYQQARTLFAHTRSRELFRSGGSQWLLTHQCQKIQVSSSSPGVTSRAPVWLKNKPQKSLLSHGSGISQLPPNAIRQSRETLSGPTGSISRDPVEAQTGPKEQSSPG